MSYPLLALQQAVFAELNGDATLMALVDDVYDQPPADASYPFVAIENVIADDWSFSGGQGVRAQIELAAYSRYHGKSECHSILARIESLLHEATLTSAGLNIVQVRVSASGVRTLSDARTTRGTLRIDIHAFE
jgi:hypothetical protein